MIATVMARCEVCDKRNKRTKSGRHRQTSNVAKRGSMGLKGKKSGKAASPNTRKVKIELPNGEKATVIMCMSCYKKFRKDQGFKTKVINTCC